MNSAFQTIVKFFRLPDLRRKFFIVLALIAFTRLISTIPIPGVDRSQLGQFLDSNSVFSLLNIFTGGGLTNFSVAMMGVGPYITASIIFQLLVIIIPSLEQLQKEGEFGRKKIAQYTRIATVPLGFIQGFGTLTFLRQAGIISAEWTPWFIFFLLSIAVAGTLFLMWIAELISEQGIGNGMSMIIATGIVSTFPLSLKNSYDRYIDAAPAELLQLGGFVLAAAIALALIIFMNEGTRNIPVSYARRVRGNKMYGGVDTHLPIKVTAAGVIPIIFAVSMVLFPSIIAQFLQQSSSDSLKTIGTAITDFFNNQWYYAGIYFLLVIAFTYFYTFIVFQPKQMAENLQRQGGYVPGTRPGEDTEHYLTTVIQRLTLVAAVFLGLVAVLPIVVQQATAVTTLSLGGTSLLIVVAVVLEIIRQVKAQLTTRTYDTYL